MQLRRRDFLFGALGLAGAAQAAEKRPNVLIYLSDQESEKVDRSLLRLPNRDRLERDGVRFRDCWCATPQCSPARGAFWTGLWPHRNGVVTNIGAVGSEPLSPKTENIGHVFRRAGYATGYFGKWHLTAERDFDGDAFGFDVVKSRGDEAGDAGVAAVASEWIGGQGDQPWLAIVSMIQPHDIYDFPALRSDLATNDKKPPLREGIEAPPSGVEDLTDRPSPQRLFNEQDQGQAANNYNADDWRRYRSFYYDLIEDADKNLGVVLGAVDGISAGEDTIVFYSSDHGDGLGAHGLPFKGPFMYEELLNIPLTISWKGKIRSGESTEFASQIDLLPTACDLAGVAIPGGLDGISLKPALEGGSVGREEIFSEYHAKQRWANPIRSVRERRWKLNVYLDGGRELYDLQDDPDERRNLAGDSAYKAHEDRLYAKLTDWAARTTDTRFFDR